MSRENRTIRFCQYFQLEDISVMVTITIKISSSQRIVSEQLFKDNLEVVNNDFFFFFNSVRLNILIFMSDIFLRGIIFGLLVTSSVRGSLRKYFFFSFESLILCILIGLRYFLQKLCFQFCGILKNMESLELLLSLPKK